MSVEKPGAFYSIVYGDFVLDPPRTTFCFRHSDDSFEHNTARPPDSHLHVHLAGRRLTDEEKKAHEDAVAWAHFFFPDRS